jgi:hypothetical protein
MATKKKAAGKPAAPKQAEPKSAPAPRSAIKPPYNHRLRSLSRAIVNSFEPDDRKEVRKALRDITEFGKLREASNVTVTDFATIVETWFNDGVKED